MDELWEVKEEDFFPYEESLFYKGTEVSLKEIVHVLNNISDVYDSVSILRNQLKQYIDFFAALKLVINLPDDTLGELDKLGLKISSLDSKINDIDDKLGKYGNRLDRHGIW